MNDDCRSLSNTLSDLFTQRDAEHSVYLSQDKTVRLNEFTHRAIQLADTIKEQPEKRWLLWANNAGDFFCQFIALCLANKHIIMPGNAQPGTLDSLRNEYDAALVDTPLFTHPAAHSAYINQQKTSGIAEQQQAIFEVVANEKPEHIKAQLEDPAPSNNTLVDSIHLYDVQITLFTSGSTSKPKAINKTLTQLLVEVDAQQQQWSDQVGQYTVLATVSHQHIYGLLHVCLWPFWRGAAFYAELHQYPEELLELAQQHTPCVLVSSPTHLERLPKSPDFSAKHSAIQSIFSSTGLLSLDAAKILENTCGFAPFEIFGSTETGGVAWRQQHTRPQDGNTNPVTPWRALPGVTISVNASGCLCVQSAHGGEQKHVMGDRVTLLDERHFLLLGRIDSIVKVEGKRLSLTEMESTLNAHPLVKSVRIIVLKRKREEVGAVIVLGPDAATKAGMTTTDLSTAQKKALSQELKQHLAAFYERILIPRRWRFVEQFPTDTQGKVTLSQLESCFNKEAL